MLETRLIPCLQLLDENLVKTVKFKNPKYIGDFKNTARIFNELEVDEMAIMAIRISKTKPIINFRLLESIASECFMPLAYGGGVDTFENAKKLFSIGFEKIIISSALYEREEEVKKVIEHFGSQSVIGCLEIGKDWLGKKILISNGGLIKRNSEFREFALKLENMGVGEILVNFKHKDGTWEGMDIEILNEIDQVVNLPIIGLGGLGSENHIREVLQKTKIQGVGMGSKVVYQKKGMGVLVNFPTIKI